MKALIAAVVAVVICALTGCVSNESARLDSYGVDLYTNGQEPTRPYKQIGILGDNARLGEEPSITAKFLKKAKKMGGDGLIISMIPDGNELTLCGVVQSYTYKGIVIVYE
jgi:hypothetical protein